jgi:biotin operon repressor
MLARYPTFRTFCFRKAVSLCSPNASPTARALLALELVQGSPGITADRLADKLGVSERAARRYVGILREAGVPIESVRGPYGGYHVGRGLRLPPLMFSATEALGLVMAVLDGHHDASDPTGPVGSALGKIVRALPEPVAAQAEAVRRTTAPAPDRAAARPDPGTTAAGTCCAVPTPRTPGGPTGSTGSAQRRRSTTPSAHPPASTRSPCSRSTSPSGGSTTSRS